MEWITGSLTVVNSLFLAYIAYQQFAANKSKVIGELFQRRYDIYNATIKSVSEGVMYNKDKGIESFGDFHKAMHSSYFLFDDEIYAYLSEIYEKLVTISVRADGDADHLKKQFEATKWLTDEIPNIKIRFKKYLRISYTSEDDLVRCQTIILRDKLTGWKNQIKAICS